MSTLQQQPFAFLLLILAAITTLCGTAVSASPEPWPDTPFRTSGRWILSATGANVTLAGISWPAHGELMIPEGLQHQSIAMIVGKIKSLGMNVVRLTYATQMVDEIYANHGDDVTLGLAFWRVLGTTVGSALLDKVLAKNPIFTSSTTRLQVFDAVVAECARQGIWVHLDNHVSAAKTACCSATDGNAWWGDRYFSATDWIRGLKFMAAHVSLVSPFPTIPFPSLPSLVFCY